MQLPLQFGHFGKPKAGEILKFSPFEFFSRNGKKEWQKGTGRIREVFRNGKKGQGMAKRDRSNKSVAKRDRSDK